jgi:hypothetical protein
VLARWRKSIIGGTAIDPIMAMATADITIDRIMATGTADITIDRIMATGTVGTTIDRIMAMGTVGITIVGGNPASALAAPSGSKMM